MISIKEGAFVISDAHYSHKRPELLDFFKDIQNKKLEPTQLILMGDIFDVLIGGVQKTIDTSKELVSILQEISKNIEVIYLEGNHDFNLKKIFVDAKVYKFSQQPLLATIMNKKVFLAHGDFDAPFGYKVYTFFIRNPIMLFFLSSVNSLFNNIILNKLDRYLDKKDDCKKIDNFEDLIRKRVDEKYKCNYFIEGHFHQNEFINFDNFNYINLAAFACNQRYFIVRFASKELLQCNKYLRE